MRQRRRRSLFVTLLAGLVLAVVWACGGSGGTTPLGVREVSEGIARATTLAEMERAFGRLFDLVGIADGSQTRTTLMRFASPHLDSGGVDHASFKDGYEALLSRLAADPSTAPYVLDLTAEQFLATVNSRLPGAYADPNAPQNAIYVLLSSRPGHVPYSTPQMTLDEGLTVVQVMMMLVVYGHIWIEENPDAIAPPPYRASAGGQSGRDGDACKEACQATFVACDATCSTTFDAAMQQTRLRFQQQVVPLLFDVLVLVSGATTIYAMLFHNCNGDQACEQTLIDAKNAAIAYAQQNFGEQLGGINLGFLDEVERNRDNFQACRQGCNQNLADCLIGCHNQGGG